MPKSCSYRLLNEGKKLPEWHPLIQKSRIKSEVVRLQITVRTPIS